MDKIIVRETSPNVFDELQFGQSIVNGDVIHSWQIVELWSDQDLAAENIYRVDRAAVPAGYHSSGYSFVRVDGSVTQVHELVRIVRSVTPWQFRKALSLAGLRQAAEDYVATQDIDVRDGWEYATEFREDNPFLISAIAALGKTEEDYKALFDMAEIM